MFNSFVILILASSRQEVHRFVYQNNSAKSSTVAEKTILPLSFQFITAKDLHSIQLSDNQYIAHKEEDS